MVRKKDNRIVNRVLQINVRHSNPDFYVFTAMGHCANNIKNEARYQSRQYFFHQDKLLKASDLNTIFWLMSYYHENNLYYCISPHVCQQILRQDASDFRTYSKALKNWRKHSNKYTDRPKPPSYYEKGDTSSFVIDYQKFNFNVNKQKIILHSNSKRAIWWKHGLKHNVRLPFNKEHPITKIQQLEVIPHKYYIQLLVCYQRKIAPVRKDNERYLSIDPGLNNLFCIGSNQADIKPLIINGRPCKSINHYFNKKIAHTQNRLRKMNHRYTSHYLDYCYTKRHFKLDNYMHEASKYVVDYALNHDISRIIIGNGATKSKHSSKMGKRNNQNFIQIPFRRAIQILQYKAQNVGIPVIITEESYTSQSSFLDNEKPCKCNGNKSRKAYGIKNAIRRKQRGLYKSNHNYYVNADLNGALQIMKKVKPDAFNGLHAETLLALCQSPSKVTMPC